MPIAAEMRSIAGPPQRLAKRQSCVLLKEPLQTRNAIGGTGLRAQGTISGWRTLANSSFLLLTRDVHGRAERSGLGCGSAVEFSPSCYTPASRCPVDRCCSGYNLFLVEIEKLTSASDRADPFPKSH
jgi:hypothetical protein